MSPSIEELVQRNQDLAAKHEPIPTFSEIIASGGKLPSLLILTCADPRCDPKDFLGIKYLEGAIVIRNVCGHVNSALESILSLDVLVTFSEFMIVHHTDCGSLQFKDEDIKAAVKKRVPGSEAEVDKMEFGATTDITQSVKDDLAALRASPFVRKELKEKTFGFVLDIKTGLLAPVSV